MAPIQRVRWWIGIFFAGLVVSGVTAFPLVWETGVLLGWVRWFGTGTAAYRWIARVHEGLVVTGVRYPFLAYRTDWLAFAHLVLAAAFVGPWRDPVRNKWVLQFGLIACAGVIPLALIAGQLRGIPVWWRLGDCSFGVVGTIPLLFALRSVKRMEAEI